MKNAIRIVSLVIPILLTACASDDAEVVMDQNWSVYLGDNGRQHYSPLTQINKSNVAQIEVAWRYTSEADVDSGVMYTSPLVIDGVLYGLSPSLVPFALNAASGKEVWRNDLGLTAAMQRGLMWWAKERRLFFSAGNQLVALNGDTGELATEFGNGGILDMTPTDVDTQRRVSFVSATVPGVVFENLIIMGFSTTEDRYAYPGTIRAFDAADGHLVWQFNTLPKPGELGSETWAEGAQMLSGGANVWTGMALDEKRGMLFAPTGSATPDFYGGNRLGDNLFANSIVAVDARTGAYRWHYQVIRHDLWDKDNPSPPTLVQMQRNGEMIDAVTLTTKTGHLYAFERDTGALLYPTTEIETSIASTLPGEQTAPTQYVSSIEISRQQFEITKRTVAAQSFVENQIKNWDLRPWAPPKLGTVLFYPWYDGGAEWGGSAYEPSTGRLIVNSNDQAAVLTLGEIPVGTSSYGLYATHCASCHGIDRSGTDRGADLNGVLKRMDFAQVAKLLDEGASGMPSFSHLSKVERSAIYKYILPEELPPPDEATTAVGYALTSGYVYLKDDEGLPGNAPPWGTLSAIDLATGDLAWRTNLGNFPSHPDLDYGSLNYGGPVVTASGLIFIAATPDRLFRAVDSDNGRILWQTELPAAGFSTPAVYAVDGRQYVVIAAGGGRLGPPSGSDYIAFVLPKDETTKP